MTERMGERAKRSELAMAIAEGRMKRGTKEGAVQKVDYKDLLKRA